MNKSVDLVHAMLARRLKKDKTFHKYMDKVDKDESGSLSSKEWCKLLAKLKKKDHASDSWELTSDIVKLTFKVVLASTGSKDDELTYAGLQDWVVAETEFLDAALSVDISSWGRNERNSSVVVHPQVKVKAPAPTINEMKDAVTKMFRKYAPEKLSAASFVDHFIGRFLKQYGFAEYQDLNVLQKEKLWSKLCQIIEKKYDCNLNDFLCTSTATPIMGTLICLNTSTAKTPEEVVMTREAKQHPSGFVDGQYYYDGNYYWVYSLDKVVYTYDAEMNLNSVKQNSFKKCRSEYNYGIFSEKRAIMYLDVEKSQGTEAALAAGLRVASEGESYADWNRSSNKKKGGGDGGDGGYYYASDSSTHRTYDESDESDESDCTCIIECLAHLICLPCYICNAICSGDGDE